MRLIIDSDNVTADYWNIQCWFGSPPALLFFIDWQLGQLRAFFHGDDKMFIRIATIATL